MSRGLYTNYNQGHFQQKYTTVKVLLPYLYSIYLVLIDENNPCKHNMHVKMLCSKIDWDNV